VRFQRDGGGERGRHGAAVRGHAAHLARGEPELDEQGGQDRGRERQGQDDGIHEVEV